MVYTVTVDGVKRDMTAEEAAQRQKDEDVWNSQSVKRKLDRIKTMRLKRLKDTDYLALGDVTMPENIKTWRQQLRDLPQDNTTEASYDLLLEVEGIFPNRKYKHSIWSKP